MTGLSMPFTHLEATRFELQTEAQRRDLLVLHWSSLLNCSTSEAPLFGSYRYMYFHLTHPHENAGLWTSLDYAKANRKRSAKVIPLATPSTPPVRKTI